MLSVVICNGGSHHSAMSTEIHPVLVSPPRLHCVTLAAWSFEIRDSEARAKIIIAGPTVKSFNVFYASMTPRSWSITTSQNITPGRPLRHLETKSIQQRGRLA